MSSGFSLKNCRLYQSAVRVSLPHPYKPTRHDDATRYFQGTWESFAGSEQPLVFDRFPSDFSAFSGFMQGTRSPTSTSPTTGVRRLILESRARPRGFVSGIRGRSLGFLCRFWLVDHRSGNSNRDLCRSFHHLVFASSSMDLYASWSIPQVRADRGDWAEF